MKNKSPSLFITSIVFALSFGLSSCTVALQQIPPAESVKALWLPKGFHAPYPLIYASTIDILNRIYAAGSGAVRAKYTRGVVGTEWYNYKYTSYPWGVTRYKYRILVNVTQLHGGFGIHVRVPVEKESGTSWKYYGRDRKIEKRVTQDIMLGIMQRNYNLVEITQKR